MNFLAHIFLSGNNNDLMIGNFIADHVKGKTKESLPSSIQKGIYLHQKIDHYTDHHPIVKLSKKRMQPKFRKYAPVVTDIFYDHFLAKNFNNYSSKPLESFAADFYNTAQNYLHYFPSRTLKMLPYMIKGNWLVEYKSINGIGKVFNGMAQRTSFHSGMEQASEELLLNYKEYQIEFTSFFSELQQFTQEQNDLILR